MRRTKIVCTLGPASNSKTEILALARAGMDVARLNFSHGSPETHQQVAERVHAASSAVGRPIGILQDLPGPKIRIGEMRGGMAVLERGHTVRLVAEELVGDASTISLPHPEILRALRVGSEVFLADGLLHLHVVDRGEEDVTARVITGGALGSHKGVNLPDADFDLPSATDHDLELFKFGLNMGVDWVAVSFVSSAADAEPFRRAAAEAGRPVRLLAKIERRKALKNIGEILEAFDGVLVARGDLGIETPIQDVPVVQKTLVRRCNRAGKPVVVATQMLMSMVTSPRPTRAEVTDVANAILDGADAVMLSEETAVGKYAPRCVTTMARVASSAEDYLIHTRAAQARPSVKAESSTDAIALRSARLSEDVNAVAIICCTASGATARAVSKHRPSVPVLAAVSGPSACGQLALSWGVIPFQVPAPANTDDMIHDAVEGALATKAVKLGDWVVITAGVQAGVPGNTSLIKYHRVGDRIWG